MTSWPAMLPAVVGVVRGAFAVVCTVIGPYRHWGVAPGVCHSGHVKERTYVVHDHANAIFGPVKGRKRKVPRLTLDCFSSINAEVTSLTGRLDSLEGLTGAFSFIFFHETSRFTNEAFSNTSNFRGHEQGRS